jgi:hypothetical protein
MRGLMSYSVLCANEDCASRHHSWSADGAGRDGWSEAKGRWRCPRHAICQYCGVSLSDGANTCTSCADERGP